MYTFCRQITLYCIVLTKCGNKCFQCFQLSGFLELTSNSLAFRTSVLRLLLFDLDVYCGVDDLEVIPLFFKVVPGIIAPRLSVIYRRLPSGLFPCFGALQMSLLFSKDLRLLRRTADRPMSITHILSKMHEKLISLKLLYFCERFIFSQLLS